MRSPGLAHDYLLTLRGAERTFAAMADCWPGAPIFTTLYDPDEVGARFEGHEVNTSYLQRLGVSQKGFRALLPLFPRAVERMDVSKFDLIVSSSSAFAHGVVPAEGAKHVCYCHNPFRYAWFERDRALSEVPALLRPILSWELSRIRKWDLKASTRVTHYIANGKTTQQRIADCYGRDSTVIHPPVETERFRISAPEDYFLFVGEVVRHKRVEVALEAAKLAGKKIRVVGAGPDRARLEAEYAGTATFCGRVDDDELARIYAGALAVIVPNVEEFGIVPVECQAAGRPVIALNEGGATETVIDGTTGVLVDSEAAVDFAEVLREVDFTRFDPAAAAAQAENFSVARFRTRITDFVQLA